jgi:octaprenyl-diphosphate synthase
MSNPGPLLREARPRLTRIQAPVRERLDTVLDELRRIVLSDFEMIEEVNQYLLLMRGKLFRPTLLLLSNEVGDRPREEAVTLAALVELVHLATLVHDDAVDHSVLRRGLPTVNALWTHQVAVIMGDYLYSRSVLELVRLRNLDAIQALARASNEMSIGEMRQLTSHDALDFSEEAYYRLIAAKTASLMCAACEMGAMVGEPAYREPLARFGHNLGMAFQIADDLLDYTGSEAQTGKPVSHDLRERKVTLPLIGALGRASAVARAEIRDFFTLVDPAEEEIRRIVEIVHELGGLDYARAKARDFADRAEDALSELESGTATEALRESVAYAIDRSR